MSRHRFFLVTGLAALIVTMRLAAAPATNGIIATVHPAATQAGLNVLKTGGNAIDAAVAAALTLGVVDSDNSGIGGGCFMLIRLANGGFVAIDGRETAPAEATRDMFVRNGTAQPELSQTGPLASGVPGAIAAYDYAVQHFGRKKLKDLLLPAAELAEQGFTVDASYAARLQGVAAEMERFDSTRAVFFKDGRPLKRGEVLKQPDLAATYRAIAKDGASWFYQGSFARATEKWMKQNGGLLKASDFAEYKIQLREPLLSTYRDQTIVGFPPPSSGGVHVAEILNILEKFEIKSMAEPVRLHVIAEAMKLAFADRAHWLGDPDFARVPRGLMDKNYAAILATNIDLEHTAKVTSYGFPANWQTDVFKKHTTHFSVADKEGNWVACTATVNTSFGSKVVIPGTGVIMNNQMDDFSAQPGVKNFFGLVGGDANAVYPRKRPLSSMSPTIVLRNGQPILSLGAAGGPKIISQVVLELVQMLDLGDSPAVAIGRPRIHHQWVPDELFVERKLSAEVQHPLQAFGHHLNIQGAMGVSQIIGRDPEGTFQGAADPRAAGTAAGW